MSKFRKNRTFQIESLEDRRLMAGDVSAYVYGDTLYVTEAPGHYGGAQAVQISQLSNGIIRVEGFWSAAGGVSKVNGAAYRDFAFPPGTPGSGVAPRQNLFVNLGIGDDSVRVWNARFNTNVAVYAGDYGSNDKDVISIYNVSASNRMTLYTGGGQDVVWVTDSRVYSPYTGLYDGLNINTGDGDNSLDRDQVFLRNVTTGCATNISTGGGNDYVSIENSKLGYKATDALQVITGAGADTVDINNGWQAVTGNVYLTTYGHVSENDNDVVNITALNAYLDLDARFGLGNDQLNMTGVSCRNMYLDGFYGADHMTLRDVQARDNFWAYMGEGDDVLDLTYVGAKNMLLDGGGGYDRLYRYQNPYIPTLTQRNWEEVNGIRMVYFTTLNPTFNTFGTFTTF